MNARNAAGAVQQATPFVLRRDADKSSTLTMNRGDRLNPLSSEMLSALQSELERIAADP